MRLQGTFPSDILVWNHGNPGYSKVISTWRPLEGTTPYSGSCGELSMEEELKVEVTIRREQLHEVMRAIRDVHPYEKPVVNVIPLYCTMMEYKVPKE